MGLEELIEQGEILISNAHEGNFDSYVDYNSYDEWRRMALMLLQEKYPNHPQTQTFQQIIGNGHTVSICNNLLSILKAFYTIKPSGNNINYDATLSNVFNRFHIVARQLKGRHAGRPTLSIVDEYDVQDLLHSLLRLHFEDVRAEEWAPSYAGGSKRMDFLLKSQEISIEVKMTRESLKDKEIGEQLIIDIANYEEHPNCKQLYCFIYDPEGLIRNPRGLESDLESKGNRIEVKVFVRPI